MAVKRSLSKNPNMLRTMIGTGLMLIVILSYAVYSNTVESEYYGYTTSNQPHEMQLEQDVEGGASWYYTTDAALTWINVSVSGAPLEDSTLTVSAEGFQSNWSHSPSLGLHESNYVCNEPESDYSGIIETCTIRREHSMELIGGEGVMRGRVSLVLPIQGKGYLENEDIEGATEEARAMIDSENKTITWRISIQVDGELASSDGVLVNGVVTTHEFETIEQFSLDPVQETVYSFATLVGCFFLVLVIPLMAYYSSVYRERRDEEIRDAVVVGNQ